MVPALQVAEVTIPKVIMAAAATLTATTSVTAEPAEPCPGISSRPGVNGKNIDGGNTSNI